MKERRKHMRIPLISERCIWFDDQGRLSETDVLEISGGGAFIRSDHMPKAKEKIIVRFSLPGDLGHLNLTGIVVWKRWAIRKGSKALKGFAVQFTDNKQSYLKILDAYCIYLRNRQIIKVSKRIMEYFFKDNQPLPDGVI